MNTIPKLTATRKLTAAGVVGLAAIIGLGLSAPPALAAASGQPVQVVLTSARLGKALSVMPAIRFSAARHPQLRALYVDDRVRYQTMVGFGAAMTDSSAWLLHDKLPVATRQRAMNALFSPAGIHLNFTRVPMGASDFTVGGQPYSYDDLPAGRTDPQLAHFSVAHDNAYIIPALRQMLRINPGIDVLATPWSPPPWMKANQAFDDIGRAGAVLPLYYQPLADYFVKFIRAYQSHGIPIWGVTPENEPNAGSAFPASLMVAQNEAAFVGRHLAPSFAAAGLHPHIYGADTGADLPYVQTLLASRGAANFSGIASHCYGGEQTMSAIHALHPTVQEIMTECSPGIIPYMAAEAAISGARNWASVITLWNLALDPSGGPVQPPNSGCHRCTGLLRISEQTHKVSYSLNYFQLGQLSKFVQPGAVRIRSPRWVSDFRGVTKGYGVTSGLDNVAFLNPDGTRVLVAYNNSTGPVRFAVSWHRRSFAYTLAAGATVTFSWK